MSDKNFQHFLEVLNEVEAKQPKEWSERRLQPIPEKCCLETCNKDMDDRPPVSPRLKTIKSKVKPVRYSLRRPGFVYRSKDFTRNTFLDSNQWELTCGRQVLKAPTFKYRYKRKSTLSPYSVQALDQLCNLTIDSKFKPSCIKLSLPINNSSQKIAASSNKFLPLTTNLPMKTTESHFPTRRKGIIRPTNFSTSALDSNKSKHSKSTSNAPETPSWTNSSPCASFSELAASKICNETDEAKPVFKIDPSEFTHFTKRAKSDQWEHSKTIFPPICNSPPSSSNSAPKPIPNIERSCSFQARMCEQDMSVDELSLYMEDFLFLPQKMSSMAEMMYT